MAGREVRLGPSTMLPSGQLVFTIAIHLQQFLNQAESKLPQPDSITRYFTAGNVKNTVQTAGHMTLTELKVSERQYTVSEILMAKAPWSRGYHQNEP